MELRIGKKLFFILLFFQTLLCAEHPLQIRIINNKNNKAVTKLALGVPYTLEIKAEGAQDLYNCKIPGIENFYSEFCGASHLNLMSHISTVHSYVIRADKLGSFTLGPVHITTQQGKKISSNVLHIRVEKEEQSDVLVELELNKTAAVVGQRIEGAIRIYDSVNMQVLNMQFPTIDKELGTVVLSDQHRESMQTIQGISYKCYEIPLSIVFKKPGNYTLEKIGVLCRVPSRKQHSLWGFNLSMHAAQDRWYYSSHQIAVHVESLPPHNEPLLGIGVFDSVALRCKQKKASMGEGIVACLELYGKEGVENAQQPILRLPEGFKYYESKTSCDQLHFGSYKKTCEYIVQATQAGTFEIPSQEFVFYDIDSKSYKKLATEPLILTITPHEKMTNQGSTTLVHDTDTEDEIASLKSEGPWIYTQERSLQWQWFIIFLMLPCIVSALGVIKKQFHATTRSLAYQKKYAFSYARKTINALKKNSNHSQLYITFNQMFAYRYELSPDQINADTIATILKKAGYTTDTIEQWNRFFLQLAELAYSKKEIIRISDDLFNRAHMWINQFEEKL